MADQRTGEAEVQTTAEQEMLGLRAALFRAYVLLKDERDAWNERRHDEVSQAVKDMAPLLNLPTADDIAGLWKDDA